MALFDSLKKAISSNWGEGRIEKHREALAEQCDLSKVQAAVMGTHAYLAVTPEAVWIVRLDWSGTLSLKGKMVKAYTWKQISSVEARTTVTKAYLEIVPIGAEKSTSKGRGMMSGLVHENVIMLAPTKKNKEVIMRMAAMVNERIQQFHTTGTVGETKECPYCAETIKAAAKKCKHCGEMLEQG